MKEENKSPSGRRLVMGDIHGASLALDQVLERCNFDFENDTLIQLGDIADGWSGVYDCVETLLKVKNLIPLRGNHDEFFVEWLNRGMHPQGWKQGGYGTLRSYSIHAGLGDIDPLKRAKSSYSTVLTYKDIPDSHKDFWRSQHYIYRDQRDIFVHGGFNRHSHLSEQNPDVFIWDRDLFMSAMSFEFTLNKLDDSNRIKKFKIKDPVVERIFIGHTSTVNWSYEKLYPEKQIQGNITEPIFAGPVINLDTGAGFKGKLTVMDADTLEFWQSDNVDELYPDERGRN
jgi:serine/threonine protein phosphatase 1